MYKLQDQPDKEARMTSDSVVTPVATLKDEYGGVSHIIEDDHCYVLISGSANNNSGCIMVNHWYPEAVEAMKSLPTPVMP